MKSFAFKITMSALILYLLIFALLYVFQRSMIFLPDTTPSKPAYVRLAGFQVVATAPDQKSWWHAPPDTDAPVIIYFHGNGGALAGRAQIFGEMARWGAGVLAVGYPGYGGNAGPRSEEAMDIAAQANYDWLISQGIDPKRIVITAHSMGTGVAVPLAAKNRAAGLILESPFLSLAAIAQRQMSMFPVKHFVKDPFRNTDYISRVKMPVVWMHGTDDQLVPYAAGEELFGMVAGPKCFLRIEGGDHDHLWDRGVRAFTQRQVFALAKTGSCDGSPVELKDGELVPR